MILGRGGIEHKHSYCVSLLEREMEQIDSSSSLMTEQLREGKYEPQKCNNDYNQGRAGVDISWYITLYICLEIYPSRKIENDLMSIMFTLSSMLSSTIISILFIDHRESFLTHSHRS